MYEYVAAYLGGRAFKIEGSLVDMTLTGFFAGKRILVTGATGLIGSHLVDELLKCPTVSVIAVGRNRKKLLSVFSRHAENARFQAVEADVGQDFPAVTGFVDWVFHAASPISGVTIKCQPASVVRANLCGEFNCLEFLRKQQVETGRGGAFVVFSSATVYGEAVTSDIVCFEEDTASCEALSSSTAAYSESKRMAEVAALAYGREYGLDIRIARFGYVYGPCSVPPQTAFYEFVGKAKHGERLVFNNAGFGRRDNIYVDDAVRGLLHICAFGQPGVPYNVSSAGELGNFAAIDEMASVIADVANESDLGVEISICASGKRAPGKMLDNARLKSLGWSLQVSLADGIRRTFNSYENNGK